MRFPYFLATLAAAVVGSITLGVLAEFGWAKIVLFTFVILVVSQLAYIAQIVILAATSHKDTKTSTVAGPVVARSELKTRHHI